MNQETPSSHQHDFNYDDPSLEQPEYVTNYEPEREFVLMPLFRRIGEIFGIGRKAEPEYAYTPEQVTEEKQASVTAEPEPASVVDWPVAEPYERVTETPAEVHAETASEIPAQFEENDVLGIEPEIAAEPLSVVQSQKRFEPEPELPRSAVVQHTEPEVVAQIEPEREVALSQSSNAVYAQPQASVQPEFQPEPSQEAMPVAARSETPRQEQVHRPLAQDDIKDLVAPIREAAISISAAISQAAEWLRSKEEEILRRAETPSAQPSAQLPRGPQLVDKPPRVPFWKRIDWDKEFTPGRAAILGALAMAVLMVLGISLARRPASSILPQQTQTQTHAIQPGGVTLTTHSARPTQMAAPSVAPAARRAHRTSSADDGPEVVTHYYGNKSKPSPTHQSTIAGVHHYSDMQ